MQQKQLAEFYRVTDRAVRKWSDEKTSRKTIQAEADVNPLEWQLVGEIAQLCYLYNAQSWSGALTADFVIFSISATRISTCFYVADQFASTKELYAKTSNTAEMQLIKMQLEKLVYGEEK